MFPTVAQNTAEPRFTTILIFRWNSCDLSKYFNGQQSQTLKKPAPQHVSKEDTKLFDVTSSNL